MSEKPPIGIIMGSDSDMRVMQKAIDIVREFDVDCEIKVVSAHRTPEDMVEYAKTARERGLKVIIAGAGGAAHLPGMVASLTTLPVIGVPVNSSNSIQGIDSLLSIAQMPGGVPVATVSVDGGKNAGLLALEILGTNDEDIAQKLEEYKEHMKTLVHEMNAHLKL